MAFLDSRKVTVHKDFIDAEKFERILKKSEPILIQNCDFGPCMTKWTLDYLKEKLADQEVSIHKSEQKELNFLDRNFTYEKCKFSEFSTKLSEPNEGSIYLRSVNENPRSKKAAKIEDDFPAIKDDLKPPSFIPFGDDELYHSSVLRISSMDTQIWTHFDIYDNILCQVVGMKRVLLFPPSDTEYLHIVGDKSKIELFDEDCDRRWPSLQDAHPRVCWMKPGDCLFIPKFWWHNIRSVVSKKLDLDFKLPRGDGALTGHSIGFNIFWRDQDFIDNSFYAENDVYGNKHLKPYKSAEIAVKRAMNELDKLPEVCQEVYSEMLVDLIRQLAMKGKPKFRLTMWKPRNLW